MKVKFPLFLFYFLVTTSQVILQPIVHTEWGPIQGMIKDNINQFLGVPFAKPPINDLRYAPPQDPTPWTQVYDATKEKPGCGQVCVLPKFLCPKEMSEDCLYLSVYTPLNVSQSQLKPVMVFIYGGGFLTGTSATPVYYPHYFVEQTDVVFVKAEYRLGAFGFLANDVVPGNQGFFDQQKVLRFVQKNIKAFGGDPNQVTLFGESAGAMSVSTHLIAPSSAGLFHSVIIESDPYGTPIPTWEEQQPRAEGFAERLGCSKDDMSCLRSKSFEDTVQASNAEFPIPDPLRKGWLQDILPWRPTISKDIPGQIIPTIAAGNYQKVPVMIGTNTNEGRLFTYQALSFMDNVEYVAAVYLIFGSSAHKVMDKYDVPYNPLDNVLDNFTQIFTDYLFACPTRKVAQLLTNDVPVYLYHFNMKGMPAAEQFWGTANKFCWDYVCHGSELPSVFVSLQYVGMNFTTDQLAVSKQMATHWSNFAKTHNPNKGLPVSLQWPQYQNSTLRNIRFETPTSTTESYLTDICNFWDQLGYDF